MDFLYVTYVSIINSMGSNLQSAVLLMAPKNLMHLFCTLFTKKLREEREENPEFILFLL